MPTPNHLAIIMDGNGRWAQNRGHRRVFGHARGARVAKAIIEASSELGIKNLTLFAFSTENWARPQREVMFLMKLLNKQLQRERENLIRNNIRFHCVGDLARIPSGVADEVSKTISATQHCTGMNLTFALSYGGRAEICAAAKALAQEAARGQLNPDLIDETYFGSRLQSSFLPDPDVILRTSGELRLSNFFLWSAAYSEIIVHPKLWPDFTRDDLKEVLKEYSRRHRRFGQTSEQINVMGAEVT